MYPLDPNINTAMRRQADQVRAVKAYGASGTVEQSAPSWTPDNHGRPNWAAPVVTLALAAAAPVAVLMVWGLIAH